MCARKWALVVLSPYSIVTVRAMRFINHPMYENHWKVGDEGDKQDIQSEELIVPGKESRNSLHGWNFAMMKGLGQKHKLDKMIRKASRKTVRLGWENME